MQRIWSCRLAVPLIAVLVMRLAAVSTAAPQEPNNPAGQPAAKGMLQPLYFGNTRCGVGGPGCHESPKAPAKDEATLGGFSTVFSRHTEMGVWNGQDKHKIATSVLNGPLGKRIAEQMHIKGEITNATTPTQWRQCLSCHGVVVDDKTPIDIDSFGAQQRVESGVSCVVCHGAYRNWVNKHIEVFGDWAKLTREEKARKYGLRDLWDPVNRAELCGSCHVGDVAQGRVVTHEMYAAGHPPLPGFEVVTFGEAMPRHWETLKEKYDRLPKLKNTYDHAYHIGLPTEEQQRLLLTGAAVAFRQSVTLADSLARASQVEGKRNDWPEFALYDCYACHHDLKADSWRQKRGYVGKPGRPQLREWPTALIPLVLSYAQPAAADYPKKLAELQAAFSSTPFGEPTEVAAKTGALMEWSDTAIKQLREARFGKGAAAKLLGSLVGADYNALVDFDSARQIGWAVSLLLPEAHPEVMKEASTEKTLKSLRDELQLVLPRGKGQIPIAQDFMPAVMAKCAAYDAVEFQKKLRELAKDINNK